MRLRQHRGIGVGGQDDTAVTELLLNGFEIGPRSMREARRAMPQIMQPNRWQVMSVAENPESAGEVIGVVRSAVRPGEHVPGLVPGIAGGPLFTSLAFGVFAQQCDGVPVQRHDPAAGSTLGRARVDRSAERRQLLRDHQLSAIQVDIHPAQSGGFATTHATKRDQRPQHILSIALNTIEEPHQLSRGPHRHRRPNTGAPPRLHSIRGPHHGMRPVRVGQLHMPGRIAIDEAFPNRAVEGRPQRGTDPLPGTGRARPAMPIGARRQLGEHLRQMLTGQARETDFVEVGPHQVDVQLIGACRGRPDRLAMGQPKPQPARHRPRRPGGLRCRLLHHRVSGGGRCGTGSKTSSADPMMTSPQVDD